MRLSSDWRESRRDAGLWGGASFDHKVFRQYQLNWAPQVTMDFWFRGFRISVQAGKAFASVLRHSHMLNASELEDIKEVLGVISTSGDAKKANIIESAEVGALKGRTVLAVTWTQPRMNRKFLSLFIDADGDGRTIHEIHFSAPLESFVMNVMLAHEAFRSIQWSSNVSLPPMSSIA